jgi:rubrerythrin
MKKDQLHELLCQAVETEKGGVEVYQTAIGLAQNEDLRKEWEEYLEQTRQHVEVVTTACEKLGLDPNTETPGRKVVRLIAKSLVKAMEEAADGGDPDGAELVAAECVGHAETKDHLNWELIGEAAKKLKGPQAKALQEAYEEVEEEEDEHLYHTKGWTRELWLKALGIPAVLPPPEEKKKVKTAIGAARAKQARSTMLKRSSA